MKDLLIRILSILLVFITARASAQDYSFDQSKYEFDPAALTSPTMDSTGYHTCLHWHRVYLEISDNGQLGSANYKLIHDLRQINDTRAVEEFNKIYLPLRNNMALLKITARVIKDGKEVYSASTDDLKTVEMEDVQYKMLALEKVEPGCLVETVTSVALPLSLSGTETLQNSAPEREQMFNLITPEHVHMRYKGYNKEIPFEEKLENGKNFVTILMHDVPGFEEEEYCHNDSHEARLEYGLESIEGVVEHGAKWSDIGNRFFENSYSVFDKSESGVKKVLKTIGISSTSSEKEKVYAIEQYLKENVEINPSAPGADLAAEVVKTHVSNLFCFNRLFMYLLDEAGIPFEVVGTCSKEDKIFDRLFESDEFFSDVLFYFPNLKSYLEPANAQVRMPVISSEFLGQDAMHIKKVELGGARSGVVTIRTIPENDFEQSVIREIFEVKFLDGLAKTQTSYFKGYTGFADQGMRALCYFIDEERRKEVFEDMVKSGQDNAEVGTITYTNYNMGLSAEYDQPFEVATTLTGSDLLEFAGDKVIFKIGNVIGTQSELYNAKPRQNPVDVEFNHDYRRTITVNIPQGYHLKGLEALNMDIRLREGDDLLAGFVSSYTVDGEKLVVTITESYHELSLPLEKYEEFRSVINAAADFNKISLLLEPA